MIDLHFKTLHEFAEFLHLFGRCRKPHRQKPLIIVGQGKVEIDMFNISAGQTKTITSVFKDTNSVEHALAAIPTAVDDQNVLVFTPFTQSADPAHPGTYTCSVTLPAGATATGGNVTVDGVNADGTHDTGVDPYTVVALDDTLVDITVT